MLRKSAKSGRNIVGDEEEDINERGTIRRRRPRRTSDKQTFRLRCSAEPCANRSLWASMRGALTRPSYIRLFSSSRAPSTLPRRCPSLCPTPPLTVPHVPHKLRPPRLPCPTDPSPSPNSDNSTRTRRMAGLSSPLPAKISPSLQATRDRARDTAYRPVTHPRSSDCEFRRFPPPPFALVQVVLTPTDASPQNRSRRTRGEWLRCRWQHVCEEGEAETRGVHRVLAAEVACLNLPI